MYGLLPRKNRIHATGSGRRPTGVSRRDKRRLKQRQLGFEPLEDRQMLSAESPLAAIQGAVADDIQLNVQSISSATPAGQAAILQNEIAWQSLIAANFGDRELSSRSIPTDPLLPNQWHLINSGQEVGNPDFQQIFAIPSEDINVAPVWNQGFTGEGVVVAVIDSGVQTIHPDLEDNISPTLQLNAQTGGNNGNPLFLDDAHGTAVAGLIGAIADNGIGGAGVAPGVVLAPIQLLGGDVTEQATINAFRFATDEIDITNNSWGPSDAIRSLDGPTANELLALRDTIFGPTAGRDGLGTIHVWAAGNGAGSGFPDGFQSQGVLDSAGYDGWVNSRYTIGVTGVDHDGFYNNADGTTTSYPETGANVLVAAPTGSVALAIGNDTGIGSGIYTTDTTGDNGFNIAPDPDTGQEFDRDFLLDTDYTSRFNGTSASAPIATGVIALMLEANPDLSWRDVQEILVRSARQNAEFEEPQNGFDQGLDVSGSQNLWITNQMSVFHDPDPWDPTIDPTLQTLNPTLDPNLGFGHYAPAPQVNTNAAGYTVSQGVGSNGEQIGYAHGVVDAELAVQLAQQWGIKNQTLPGELSFTTFVTTSGNEFSGNIPAVEKGSADTGFQLVPGGLGGSSGFIAFWEEYFADEPDFSQTFPFRGAPLDLSVPLSNTMSIETVELKLSLAGGTADALDNLRIMLTSPDGTQSELNHFYIEPNAPFTLQNLAPSNFITDGVSNDPDGGNMVWTFSTNRSWGERSDDALIFDATTGEPMVDFAGNPLTRGLQVVFENYGGTAFNLDGLEVAWHGSPIGAGTQRVQGFVGLDENRDDQFNFSRVTQEIGDIDGDPNTLRDTSFLDAKFGIFEIRNVIDPTQEDFADNVTVTARRVSDNVVVDQFITGDDGNYYFDLVPDEYIISIDDPLGRTAVDDSITPAGFLQEYQNEWRITSDFFKVWDYDTNLEVPVDGTGTPGAWLDGNGQETVNGMKHINFLLDPGPPPLPQVEFSGTVFADINGDGLFNPDDVEMPQISVFADENRNGQFDAGELVVNTDINGQYILTVPSTFTTVMNVGVIPPVDWTATNPASAWQNFFVEPGDTFADVDFAIMPPGVSEGDGTSQPGYMVGVVFNDINGDSRRQESEAGVSGLRVFIDANNTGVIDAGDTVTTTNVHGGFAFAGVPAGDHIIRVEVIPPNEQTLPLGYAPLLETLEGAGTISGLTFGVRNSSVIIVQPSTLDFGDLPDRYGVTTLFQDGARHVVGPFFLGQLIDTEEDGQPSGTATQDDITELADEDGITFDSIQAGGSGRIVVNASRYGGYLSGWMDFNGDDDFDDVIDGVSERLVLTKIGGDPETRTLLVSGLNEITYDLPATIDAATIFARFRYGEFENVDSLTGMALVGEVEDYAIPVAPPLPLVSSNGSDLDADGDVDGFDFLAWQRGFGKTSGATPAEGDVTGDGAVDGDDLAEIQADFGSTSPQTGNLVVESSDFNTDGDVDGADFLAWQRGAGTTTTATLADGDANGDKAVDGSDLAIWQSALGDQNTQAAQASSVALAIAEPSQLDNYNYEPYSIAALLGNQTAPVAADNDAAAATETVTSTAALNVSTVATTPAADLVTDDSETNDNSFPGNIRIVHHGSKDSALQQNLKGLRGLTISKRLQSIATSGRKVMDLGQLAQSLETRWDRSIQTDLSNVGHGARTPARDRALADLFGSKRQTVRKAFKQGSRLRLTAIDDFAGAVEQQDALLAALSEKIDWRR